jgi:hypothetical protein
LRGVCSPSVDHTVLHHENGTRRTFSGKVRKENRRCDLVARAPSRRYQILGEIVGLERGPPSPVRIIEDLLE